MKNRVTHFLNPLELARRLERKSGIRHRIGRVLGICVTSVVISIGIVAILNFFISGAATKVAVFTVASIYESGAILGHHFDIIFFGFGIWLVLKKLDLIIFELRKR